MMAIYSEASTVVRKGKGESSSFEVKVGMHQDSVLSNLLFAIVMDVVTKEVRGGLPWELLSADDFVLATTTREGLRRKLARTI